MYLRYSHFFEGRTEPGEFQVQLTQLAEQLLQASVSVACDEMQLQKSPVAVIGFGKLGSMGMMPKSDLDLVYLCQSMQEHVLASQFASRLNTVVNTPMREGRVYELDTRLRPSGQSGSVTISLNSYRQHQMERAHTWSHLALVAARSVAGDADTGAQFHAIKAEILSRPRDLRQFKYDCAKMLKRVRDQRIKPAESDQFIAKHRPGGLFELEYVLSSMIVLECIEQPQLARSSYDQMLEAVLKQQDVAVATALRILRGLQLEIRLFGHDDMRFGELPSPILEHVLATLRCENVAALIEAVEQSTRQTRQLIDEFFADVELSELGAWKETSVNWQ